MKEKLFKSGNTVLFDARTILLDKLPRGKRLLKMASQQMSFQTNEGVKFFKQHPYQLVSIAEAEYLLSLTQPSFVQAELVEVHDYYC